MTNKTKITAINLFATPKDMKELQNYLGNFNGSEATVAQTCAWMAWNLACKLTDDTEKLTSLIHTTDKAKQHAALTIKTLEFIGMLNDVENNSYFHQELHDVMYQSIRPTLCSTVKQVMDNYGARAASEYIRDTQYS